MIVSTLLALKRIDPSRLTNWRKSCEGPTRIRAICTTHHQVGPQGQAEEALASTLTGPSMVTT